MKQFWQDSDINVLKWPAKSPDLNIAEDVWKMVSDRVYEGPQFENKESLILAVKKAVDAINRSERHLILNLFDSLRSRLCKVLTKNGNMYNK